jgi:hypothetical protein
MDRLITDPHKYRREHCPQHHLHRRRRTDFAGAHSVAAGRRRPTSSRADPDPPRTPLLRPRPSTSPPCPAARPSHHARARPRARLAASQPYERIILASHMGRRHGPRRRCTRRGLIHGRLPPPSAPPPSPPTQAAASFPAARRSQSGEATLLSAAAATANTAAAANANTAATAAAGAPPARRRTPASRCGRRATLKPGPLPGPRLRAGAAGGLDTRRRRERRRAYTLTNAEDAASNGTRRRGGGTAAAAEARRDALRTAGLARHACLSACLPDW